jgi:hypothetical protein
MQKMQKKSTVIALCFGVILVIAAGITMWWGKTAPTSETPPAGDYYENFDWKIVREIMVTGGPPAKGYKGYTVEELPLRHLQIPGGKIIFLVDSGFEGLLGPRQTIFVYYPETKVLDHDLEHLRRIIEKSQYQITSTDELLDLAKEIVPIWHGSNPKHHKFLTEDELFSTAKTPITKESFRTMDHTKGMLVSYYAEIGPWHDIVHPTVVLIENRISIKLAHIYDYPRTYQ